MRNKQRNESILSPYPQDIFLSIYQIVIKFIQHVVIINLLIYRKQHGSNMIDGIEHINPILCFSK
jgi:hypothetical protein